MVALASKGKRTPKLVLKLMPIKEEEDMTKEDDDQLSTCSGGDSDSDCGDDCGDDWADELPVLRRPPGLAPPPPGLSEPNQEDEAARIKAEQLAQRMEAAKARLANANAWLVQQQQGVTDQGSARMAGAASAYNPQQGLTDHRMAHASAYTPQVAWCDPQASRYYQNNMNWACQSAWTSPNWTVPTPAQSFA